MSVPGLGEAYGEVFGGLRGFFASRGVSADEATDLAQESITRALLHINRHGVTSDDVWPLLRTIAKNLFVERVRRSRPNLVPLSDAIAVEDELPAPDELAAARERRVVLRRAVSLLPTRQRRVIEMSMDGLSPAEIARELGIKRNAADALMHRARRSLASHFRSEGFAGFGFFGAVMLRFRQATRRLAMTATRFDTPTNLAIGASGLAAATIAAMIAIGGPAAFINHAPTGSSARRVIAVGTSSMQGRATPTKDGVLATPGVRSGSTPAIVADLNAQHIGAGAHAENPTSPGDNNFLQVDVWHRRDPGHRGYIGPMLDGIKVSGCPGSGC